MGANISKVSAARRLVLLVSYVAAGVTFAVSNPDLFWNPEIAIYMTEIAGPVAGAAFVIWLILVAWAFAKFGQFKWWFVIAAPFALWTPLRTLLYVIMYMIYSMNR